jgi:hypothetical protein
VEREPYQVPPARSTIRSAGIFYYSTPALQRTIMTLCFFCKTRNGGTLHAAAQQLPLNQGIWKLSRP